MALAFEEASVSHVHLAAIETGGSVASVIQGIAALPVTLIYAAQIPHQPRVSHAWAIVAASASESPAAAAIVELLANGLVLDSGPPRRTIMEDVTRDLAAIADLLVSVGVFVVAIGVFVLVVKVGGAIEKLASKDKE